jgi:hypothetical protein
MRSRARGLGGLGRAARVVAVVVIVRVRVDVHVSRVVGDARGGRGVVGVAVRADEAVAVAVADMRGHRDARRERGSEHEAARGLDRAAVVPGVPAT